MWSCSKVTHCGIAFAENSPEQSKRTGCILRGIFIGVSSRIKNAADRSTAFWKINCLRKLHGQLFAGQQFVGF